MLLKPQLFDTCLRGRVCFSNLIAKAIRVSSNNLLKEVFSNKSFFFIKLSLCIDNQLSLLVSNV